MGQDSWNLQYGKSHPSKQRKGEIVDMHNNEGYGSQMVPGYGQARISKTKIIGKKDKPPKAKVAGSGYKSAREEFMTPQKSLKRRK